MLPSHEPRGEDPDDRHEKREGSNGRRRVARHQPVPAAVAEKGRDDDDVSEGGEADAPTEDTALCQRPVPSKISDSPSSGGGATTLDQTSSEKGRFGFAARVTTFPQPHDAADATPRATA